MSKIVIHHIDGNPLNNDPANLLFSEKDRPADQTDQLRWAITEYLADWQAYKSTPDFKLRLARMAWAIRDKLPPELATYAALLGGTDGDRG